MLTPFAILLQSKDGVKMTSKYETYNPILKPCKLLQKHHGLPLGEGVLNKVLYREAPP